jgi:hypothetical protein
MIGPVGKVRRREDMIILHAKPAGATLAFFGPDIVGRI